MIRRFPLLLALSIILASRCGQAQSALNPADPQIRFNQEHPPRIPQFGELSKWVSTKSLEFETNAFKSYFYKGMPYRLRFPRGYKKNSNKRYPLIVFLHGGRELGNIYDNELQLFQGAEHFQSLVEKSSFDGFLLFPQAASGDGLFHEGHFLAIKNLIEEQLVPFARVDRNRIVAHGISAGGISAWNFALLYPELFAALITISATPLDTLASDAIDRIMPMPIWLFMGRRAPLAQDGRALFKNLTNQGAQFRYTEYPLLRHRCWKNAWSEPDFLRWINSVHQANPWVRYGRKSLCGGASEVELHAPAGFEEYQWRKDGEILSGAASNILRVRKPGTYGCRLRLKEHWSAWSPLPAQIRIGCETPQVLSLPAEPVSSVLPPYEKSLSPALYAPAGYTEYQWERAGVAESAGNSRVLTDLSPGRYRARIHASDDHAPLESPWFEFTDAAHEPLKLENNFLSAQSKSAKQIDVHWKTAQHSIPRDAILEIYRSESKPVNIIPLADVKGTEYFDTPPPSDDKAEYRVAAVLATEATVTLQPITTAEKHKDGTEVIRIDWKRAAEMVREKIDHFSVARITPFTTPFFLCAKIPFAKGRYADTLVSPGFSYQYQARIAGAGHASAISNSAFAQTPLDITPPSPIRNLRQVASWGGGSRITWDESVDANDEVAYAVTVDGHLYRNAGELQALITGLDPLREHEVRVHAHDNSGNQSVPSGTLKLRPESEALTLLYYQTETGATPSIFDPAQMVLLTQSAVSHISVDIRLSDKPALFLWRVSTTIAAEGAYTFRISTNGVAKLYHSEYSSSAIPIAQMTSSESGQLSKEFEVTLHKGRNIFSVLYYFEQGKPEFNIEWKAPGSADFKPFPADRL